MWASVCLALYVAFWLELDNPFWAGTTAAIVCQPQLGASLRKGWFRLIGTVVGAVMSVVLAACFPQDRTLFLGGLALWGVAATFVTPMLRYFASYAAALAGYTVGIIASDLLGATSGVNADAAFLLAVYRASEISIGIVCAGVVLAGTDLGGAPHRLAALFADLSAEIMSRFTGILAMAGTESDDTQPVRRELLRRVIALEPIIDQSVGESSRLRYRSPVLQSAVDGLFAASAGWRAVANHLLRLPHDAARQEAAVILQSLPQEVRSGHGEPAQWIADPSSLLGICEAAARRLIALPAGTPSLRLLADKTAEVMAGMTDALNGLPLIVADPARPVPRRPGIMHLRAPDWLPALVNAGRTLVVIGAVTLFWIVTVWPSGASAITFVTITVTLMAPQANQAYTAAVFFTVGSLIDIVLTAIMAFAVLTGLGIETFVGVSFVIAPCLVLIGAALAYASRPWQTALSAAMALQFVPLLAPTNPMGFDALHIYSAALAIVAGSAAGALSFRLLPPLSPAFRTRRLLALTLRDLHRLATERGPADRAGRIYGALGNAGRGDAAAARRAPGGTGGRQRDHPSPPHRASARPRRRSRPGTGGSGTGQQRECNRTSRLARRGACRSWRRRPVNATRPAGAREHSLAIGGADRARQLLRRRSTR